MSADKKAKKAQQAASEIALRDHPRNALEITRRGLADSRNEFSDAVSAFSGYTDFLGESATSAGGLVISFNRAIKAALDVAGLNSFTMSRAAAAYAHAAQAITVGIARMDTRKQIKAVVRLIRVSAVADITQEL